MSITPGSNKTLFSDAGLMSQVTTRIAWLEARIEEVEAFVVRDREKLAAAPGEFSTKLSLDSWLSHLDELQTGLAAEAVRLKQLKVGSA